MRTSTLLLTAVLILFLGTTGYAEKKGKDNKKNNAPYGAKVKAHRHEQHEENTAYRKEIKDLPAEERKAKIQEHRSKQYEENVSFRRQMHEERKKDLEKRLMKNKKLTDAQKAELINFYDQQFEDAATHRGEQNKENMAFFEKIANDDSLTMEQKKEAIKKHREEQKKENKDFRKEQKNENKEMRDKLRLEMKKDKASEDEKEDDQK